MTQSEEMKVDADLILKLAIDKEVHKISELWQKEFDEVTKAIDDILNNELSLFSNQKVNQLASFFRLSIGHLIVENDIKAEIHQYLLKVMIIWLNDNIDDHAVYKQNFISEILLCCELESFESSAINQCIKMILNDLNQGTVIHAKTLSILALLLNSAISLSDILNRDGINVNGQQYIQSIIEQLCESIQWHSQHVVLLLNCLRDVTLTGSQLELVVKKLEGVWECLDIEEIPSFVYQLLLFSKQGSRNIILGQIINHFNTFGQELECSDSDLSCQRFKENTIKNQCLGTVMSHLNMAIKQDHELGNHLIKFLKSGKAGYFSPFSLAILFSISRMQRFEETIFDHIKSSLLGYYSDKDHIQNLPEMFKVYSINSVDDIFDDLLNMAQFGWDQILQGLIEFSTLILDTNTKPFGRTVENVKPIPKNGPKTSLDRAHQLCHNNLLTIFKKFELFRSVIIEKIISRILSNSDSLLSYLNLLKSILEYNPHQLASFVPKFKDLLPILLTLKSIPCKHLIKALSPLIINHPSFLDSLIMVLKKGIFTRTVQGRINSLSGLIKVLILTTQPPLFIPNQDISDCLPALGLEIMGVLRRCLTQQGEVKMALYDELGMAANLAPILAPFIAELLEPQVQKYLQFDQSNQKFLGFKSCLNINSQGDSIVIEPLASLLGTVIICIDLIQKNEQESRHGERLSEILSNLMKILISMEIDKLGFDKETTFSLGDSEGRTNVAICSLILGVIENLIEYVSLTFLDGEDKFGKIDHLFEKHQQLFQLLKDKMLDERGKPIIKRNIEVSHLSLDCAVTMLYQVTIPENEGIIGFKSSHVDMAKYLLTVCSLKIDELSTRFSMDYQPAFNPLRLIALLFTLFIVPTPNVIELDQDCYKLGFETVLKTYDLFLIFDNEFRHNITGMLNAVCSGISYDERYEFDPIMFKCISESLGAAKTKNLKNATYLFQVINKLLATLIYEHQISPAGLREISEDLTILSQEFRGELGKINVADGPLFKELLQFNWFVTITNETEPSSANIALAVQRAQGKIPRDEESEEAIGFDITFAVSLEKVLKKSSVSTGLNAVVQHITADIDRFGWALSFISNHHELDQVGFYLIRKVGVSAAPIEQVICTKMMTHIQALDLLVQTNLVEPLADPLLDILNKVYKLLTQFAKFKLKHGLMRKDAFIDLVEMVGLTLSQNFFAFVNYVQVMATINAQNNPSRAKKPKPNDKNKIKAKVGAKIGQSKEIRILSMLTYHLEQFERFLIQISKKFKVKVMHKFKRSTVRDFRIDKDIFLRSPTPPIIDLKEESRLLFRSSAPQNQEQLEENEAESEQEEEEANQQEENVISSSHEEHQISDQVGSSPILAPKKRRNQHFMNSDDEQEREKKRTRQVERFLAGQADEDEDEDEEEIEDEEDQDRYDSDIIDDENENSD